VENIGIWDKFALCFLISYMHTGRLKNGLIVYIISVGWLKLNVEKEYFMKFKKRFYIEI